ncbi:type II toxin-antitoxin system RelE/ParE family toxin [Methylomonas sp.]|uniref:type II toxin-antitoxin system RelE/ParE family toxin n=1 Tax=Methylomonas sp. TaxID=418 RepID=UPI00342D96FE
MGLQFLNELDAAIRRIVAYPDAYVSIGYGLRRCLVNRFPYAILYGIDSNKIVIVAVAHLHRKPHFWLNRITS